MARQQFAARDWRRFQHGDDEMIRAHRAVNFDDLPVANAVRRFHRIVQHDAAAGGRAVIVAESDWMAAITFGKIAPATMRDDAHCLIVQPAFRLFVQAFYFQFAALAYLIVLQREISGVP
jgi:hypothetical protein